MGNCTSTKKPEKGSSVARRKYSVYFPSKYKGVQKYSEKECKANGLNFEDIQAIFNKQHEAQPQTTCENNNEQESTHIKDGRSSILNPQKLRTHYTAKLKRGDSDEDYAINKDTFKNFDFN
ncbi:hypothetical protein ABPG74_016351 [Tetrahymena malaccensis]